MPVIGDVWAICCRLLRKCESGAAAHRPETIPTVTDAMTEVTHNTAATHFIEGRDVRYAYRELGPAGGPPLVLRRADGDARRARSRATARARRDRPRRWRRDRGPDIRRVSGRPVLGLAEDLYLFFSPSPTSQAAGRRYWSRVNERGPDRESPVSEATIKARVIALTA